MSGGPGLAVAFCGGYGAGGTGIVRYQRELIDAFLDHQARHDPAGSSLLFTPFNRSGRPSGLPAACGHRRSAIPGKLQKLANRAIGLPIERQLPSLAGVDLIHSLVPEAIHTRRPWLVTVHDVAWRSQGPGYAAVFPRSMQRSAEASIRDASHLVAVSRFTADELIAGGVARQRISVIYQGIPMPPPPAASDGPDGPDNPDGLAGLELPERFVLSVGTFHPRKNLALIARAYARADSADLLPCLLVGPPPPQPLAALGVDGHRLRHLGYLDDALLTALLRRATALIFPSRHEGFGRPLIEAMALGLPVVASAIPVFRELAGDDALFVEVDASDADRQLAEQLRRLAADPGLAADLAERGRRSAARFSWQRCCEELQQLYLRWAA